MHKPRKKEISERLFLEESRQDFRISILAVLLTILIHATVFFSVPDSFLAPDRRIKIDELELEILPPQLEEVKRALPVYVEANPDANMTPPDRETLQESFQDQRAAQENPDPKSDDSFPEVDGEEIDSKKIVSGDLEQQTQASAMSKVFETLERPLERPSEGDSSAVTEMRLPSLQFPLAGGDPQSSPPPESGKGQDALNASPIFDGFEDEDAPAASENFAAEQNEAAHFENTSEDEKMSAEIEVPEIPVAEMELPKPAPRKTVKSVITRTPPGPLSNSNMRANKTGIVAVDSKFSEFGAYQQRMVEAIARQWHLLASRYDIGAIYNTQVTVEFFLDHDGEITSYKTTFNTSSITGKNLCEQAILSTAPYGPWTREMRTLFGDQAQSVKFNFYYR